MLFPKEEYCKGCNTMVNTAIHLADSWHNASASHSSDGQASSFRGREHNPRPLYIAASRRRYIGQPGQARSGS